MYEVVPLAKVGDNVPAEKESPDKSALVEALARVITVEYVVLVPSSAVTLTSTVFAPTASETEEVPEINELNAPEVPKRYSIVAPASDFVAVIVTEVTVYATDVVYEVVPLAKVGDNVPLENESVVKAESVEGGSNVKVDEYEGPAPHADKANVPSELITTDG